MNPFTLEKNLRAFEISRANRLPVVNLVESGRRRPPHPGRPLRARRQHLPGADPALGPGHPDGRARVRQLDRRRRLRARHVRPLGDGRPAGQGLPRRASAGQDGDRRGGRRRVARWSGHALTGLGSEPTTSPSTSSTASGSAARSSPTSTGASAGPAPSRPADEPRRRCRRAARHRVGRPPGAVRPEGGDRPRRRRLAVRRVQGGVRHVARLRLGVHPRLPGRHPRQRPGRAVHGRVEEGHGVHPAGQPDRHPAGVPAERHRLHGRQGLRAGGDHQGRGQDDQRGRQQHRAPPHGDHGRVLRGRELRHVRPGVRPPLPLHLAQRPHRGDGSPAAGRGALDRGPPESRGRRPALRRGGRRRPAPAGRRSRSRPSPGPCS